MSLPGFWELMIILGIVLLLFGGKRLPALGSALGEGIKNFKKGLKGEKDKNDVPPDKHA